MNKPTIFFCDPAEIFVKISNETVGYFDYYQKGKLTTAELLEKYDIDYASFIGNYCFYKSYIYENKLIDTCSSKHDVNMFLSSFIE